MKTMTSGLRRWLVSVGSHPIINGIAAVVSVLAGALASFFTGAIRESLGLPADPARGTQFSADKLQFSTEALIFWGLVFVAALLFAWSKYSDSATHNEHKDALNGKLRDLESMPPDTFLEQLSDQFATVFDIAAQARSQVTSKADVDNSIKKILDVFTQIAVAYDGHIPSREYRVYLMLFSRKWDKEKLALAVNVNFLSADAQSGIIEASPSLCVLHSADRLGRPRAFDAIPEYALPVYKAKSTDDQINVLSGPPKVFFSDRVFECRSVSSFLADMHKDFPDRNQVEAMEGFYKSGAGKGVKSFVSIRIPANNWTRRTIDLAGADVWGVVNIEANEEDVMSRAGGYFWPVVQPILLTLSDLIALRSFADEKATQAA